MTPKDDLTTGQTALVIGVVGAAAAFIAPVVVVIGMPLTIWRAWAINKVLLWHYPSFAIGLWPIAGLLLVYGAVQGYTKTPKDMKWYEPYIFAVLFPPLLVFAGWVLTVLRGWFA